jgi:hypothetical protein
MNGGFAAWGVGHWVIPRMKMIENFLGRKAVYNQ